MIIKFKRRLHENIITNIMIDIDIDIVDQNHVH